MLPRTSVTLAIALLLSPFVHAATPLATAARTDINHLVDTFKDAIIAMASRPTTCATA